MNTMKRLLGACICLLFWTGSWAAVVTIQLFPNHEDWEIDKRSITVAPPVATHDGSTISIYFPTLTTESQIVVKDAMETILYAETITSPTECHTFTLDIGNSVSTDKEYQLEVRIGNQTYYGYFQL